MSSLSLSLFISTCKMGTETSSLFTAAARLARSDGHGPLGGNNSDSFPCFREMREGGGDSVTLSKGSREKRSLLSKTMCKKKTAFSCQRLCPGQLVTGWSGAEAGAAASPGGGQGQAEWQKQHWAPLSPLRLTPCPRHWRHASTYVDLLILSFPSSLSKPKSLQWPQGHKICPNPLTLPMAPPSSPSPAQSSSLPHPPPCPQPPAPPCPTSTTQHLLPEGPGTCCSLCQDVPPRPLQSFVQVPAETPPSPEAHPDWPAKKRSPGPRLPPSQLGFPPHAPHSLTSTHFSLPFPCL